MILFTVVDGNIEAMARFPIVRQAIGILVSEQRVAGVELEVIEGERTQSRALHVKGRRWKIRQAVRTACGIRNHQTAVEPRIRLLR